MLCCTRPSVPVQAEQLLDQRSPEDDFAQQLRLAVYMIARDYVKARQEALEAKQAVKEAMQRTDRVAAEALQRSDMVAAEARQDVKEAKQDVKEAMQRTDRVAAEALQRADMVAAEARQDVKEAMQRAEMVAAEARQDVKEAKQDVKEAMQRADRVAAEALQRADMVAAEARQDVKEAKQDVKEAMQRADMVAAEAKQDVKEAMQKVNQLTMQLGSARATLRQTEIRLEERTLDAARDCSAMYARVIIEWFELSRRIRSPRQKAWAEYLEDNPDFNIRLQESCGKHFDGKWDVGVQKAYQTLSSYIHNCPPVLYGGSGNERILILSDAIPSFVGCLVQFLANEVLSIKIRVQYK
jgi:small-conductance mechanosensitive channel